jgi:hypothetical protein
MKKEFTPKQLKMITALRIMLKVADRIIEKRKIDLSGKP